ncbi:hypothetical protein LUW76_24205 [Actinomadura madurae]|uniref:hypothetical protein n=1 Tax=Actinomadura madurae TaxID=1993 RepID=UPI002026CA50|nr:hypothetical protein [Actinomadura madurae]URM97205.1 hypothetical protein LUW76_24205 [Actinomadura madurae]
MSAMYTASATAVTVVRGRQKKYERSCRHWHLAKAGAERCARHLEDEIRELAGDRADQLVITHAVTRTAGD